MSYERCFSYTSLGRSRSYGGGTLLLGQVWVQGGRWLLGPFAFAGDARVGRGGYRAQVRARKDAPGLEEVREGVQDRCLGRGAGRTPDD